MRGPFTAEFTLAAACCRWPLSDAALAEVSAAVIAGMDWTAFRALVRRHRIAGLAQNALAAANVALPADVAGTGDGLSQLKIIGAVPRRKNI